MFGKILKVSSNDLYGNVDDRLLKVYACFKHIKYGNNYVVFSVVGDEKKLCFGSVHLKKSSLVIFSVKDEITKYVLDFINEYINSSLINFEIFKLDDVEKVELVSYNDIEYEDLSLLDEKSIPKIVVNDEENISDKKPVFLYFLIFVLFLLGIGISVLYFKPELFTVKYKGMICTNKFYDENLKLNYEVEKNMIFDVDDKLEKINVTKTYIFLDSNNYYILKEDINSGNNLYFTNGESIKFVDDSLTLKLFYDETSVIDDYDEMLTYLKREGYSCVENEYEK